jgi:protein-S-isoprenylcysteine O-methyltransferase Ste14
MVGIVYATIPTLWLLIHPFAESWRSRGTKAGPTIYGTWFLVMVAAGLFTAPWRLFQLYPATWSWIAWALLFIAGAMIYRRIGHFGYDNISGRTELEPELIQRLVTSGLHSRVRHPIYLAHLLMLTGWALGSGLIVLYALLAVSVITGFFMIRAEDAELERRFGDEYRAYKRRVPAILPIP